MPLRNRRSESGDRMFNDDDADERSGGCGLPTSSVDLLSDGWYFSQLDADTYRQLPPLFAQIHFRFYLLLYVILSFSFLHTVFSNPDSFFPV